MEVKILTAQDLAGVVSVIDVCSQRGAFRGEELAGVGRLRETFLAEIREPVSYTHLTLPTILRV